jgi:transcriptional regulator with XRE-family HTH domain
MRPGRARGGPGPRAAEAATPPGKPGAGRAGQDPAPSPTPAGDTTLELAIGREVREFRQKLDMTAAELARASGISVGMVSKIENGLTSPSLATLQALGRGLQVPVTSFFRRYEETQEASHVKAGQGVVIERRGTRAGHQYQLLGHGTGRRDIVVEPYLITLAEKSEVFPLFQHAGLEFLHVLEGRVVYRHGDKTYLLEPGDSLLFDANAPHGPEELLELPIRFISIMASSREQD